MRVALIGHYPINPEEIIHGPQAVFTYLIEGLRKYAELDLHVITAHKSIKENYSLQRDGVKFYYVRCPRGPAEYYYPMLQKSIHSVLHRCNPDLVHGQTGHRYGCIALSSGYPAVLTVHSIQGSESRFEPFRINQFRMSIQYLLSRKYFVANVRYLVSINKYIRNYYESIVNATIYDIANPIADSFFELDPNTETPNSILFVGWLSTLKRPELALEAFALAQAEIPDLRLNFVGTAVDPILKSRMDDFIKRKNITDRVRFLGHQKIPQLLEIYQQTSMLLLTSDLETSPMVVQQSMAAGKPVVATAVGGLPYLIDDRQTGLLVEPNNPESIAEALVMLAIDHKMKKMIGEEARREALDQFQVDVVARKTFTMYQEILNGTPEK